MELSSCKIKKIILFWEMRLFNPKIKKVLIFSQKKLFLYLRKRNISKKLSQLEE